VWALDIDRKRHARIQIGRVVTELRSRRAKWCKSSRAVPTTLYADSSSSSVLTTSSLDGCSSLFIDSWLK
jgi:hypothetical protein